MGEKNAIVIHLTLVPYLAAAGIENKTKTFLLKPDGSGIADVLVVEQNMKFLMIK
jgi:CTP synthase (UTP-ammonia lyase)